jgi:Mrp family chromosome partitioning ATPase
MDRARFPIAPADTGAVTAPSPGAVRAYRYVSRTIAREFARGDSGAVLAFTCPDSDEACTNVMLLQADALREELESSVLLVDARGGDRGGGLTQRLGMEALPGFADLLAQPAADFSRLVQRTVLTGVDVLPRGTGAARGMGAMQGQLHLLVMWARTRYRHVLLQVGAVTTDTRNLVGALQADAVVVVAREHGTPLHLVEEADEVLRENGAPQVVALVVERAS